MKVFPAECVPFHLPSDLAPMYIIVKNSTGVREYEVS